LWGVQPEEPIDLESAGKNIKMRRPLGTAASSAADLEDHLQAEE
jgi:hypothetical protein